MQLTPEEEFILRSMQSFLGNHGTPLGRDVSWDRLCWDKILSIGRHQNLFPLLYHVLSRRGLFNYVPCRVQQELEEGFLDNAALTLLYDDLLQKAMDSFQEEAIPIITVKGPSVALEFYDPREVRPYTDLDLLIQEKDFERAKSLLFRLGLRIAHPEEGTIRRRHLNSVNFSKTAPRQINLDLHWETCMISWNKRPFLSSESVWENVRWLKTPAMMLPVLQPHDLVLYLAVHLAFHHQFGRLLTLSDLDLLIQTFGEKMDWEEIARKAENMKIKKPVYYSLKLASSLFKTKIPGTPFPKWKPSEVEERWIPFDRLVFRDSPLSGSKERFIKFLLIDDLRAKGASLVTFFRYQWARRAFTDRARSRPLEQDDI